MWGKCRSDELRDGAAHFAQLFSPPMPRLSGEDCDGFFQASISKRAGRAGWLTTYDVKTCHDLLDVDLRTTIQSLWAEFARSAHAGDGHSRRQSEPPPFPGRTVAASGRAGGYRCLEVRDQGMLAALRGAETTATWVVHRKLPKRQSRDVTVVEQTRIADVTLGRSPSPVPKRAGWMRR